KAPTQGGAYIMMVLDYSLSMEGSSPIRTDFFGGASCANETLKVSTSRGGNNYDFDGSYCWIADTLKTNRTRNKQTYTEIETQRRSNRYSSWGNSSSEKSNVVSDTEQLSDQRINNYSNLNDSLKSKITNTCVISTSNTNKTEGNDSVTGTWTNWSENGNTRTRSRLATLTGPTSFTENIQKYS